MLDNPTVGGGGADSIPVVKRYAPPNQRNRSINRRKSAEKNQLIASRYINVVDQGDVGSSNFINENPRPRLIPLEGCHSSEASQLLNDRWETAMRRYNDPSVDLSERPVLYSGTGGPAWIHFRLPHQLMPPAVGVGASSGSQMDFLGELRRAMHNSNVKSDC